MDACDGEMVRIHNQKHPNSHVRSPRIGPILSWGRRRGERKEFTIVHMIAALELACCKVDSLPFGSTDLFRHAERARHFHGLPQRRCRAGGSHEARGIGTEGVKALAFQ